MSKYIIKNCENLVYCTSCKEYECAIADDFGYKRRCADNDNCNLKQIVELCTDAKKYGESFIRIDNILDVLDIQEVE